MSSPEATDIILSGLDKNMAGFPFLTDLGFTTSTTAEVSNLPYSFDILHVYFPASLIEAFGKSKV